MLGLFGWVRRVFRVPLIKTTRARRCVCKARDSGEKTSSYSQAAFGHRKWSHLKCVFKFKSKLVSINQSCIEEDRVKMHGNIGLICSWKLKQLFCVFLVRYGLWFEYKYKSFYLSCTGVLGAKQVNFGNQVPDWSNLQTLPLLLNISFLKQWCRWPTSLDDSFCWKFCRSTITLVIDIQYEFVYVTTVFCACSMSSSLCYCP